MSRAQDVDYGFIGEHIRFQILLTGRAVRSGARDSNGGRIDKPPGWYSALVLIGLNPGISQKRLANVLYTDPSIIVGMVDDLTREGMAVRNRSTADRRRVELQLTPAGQEELVRIRHVSEMREVVLRDSLSPAEREQLIRLLGKVRVAVRPEEID